MTLEEFQEASRAKTVEPGKRPKPYSAEQRAFALEYASQEMTKGKPKSAILKVLGISYTTLAAWQSPGGKGKRGFRRVAVKTVREGGGVTLVTPTGYRVECLSVDDVAKLLKTLG